MKLLCPVAPGCEVSTMAVCTSSFLSSSSSCHSLCFRFNPLLFSSASRRRSTLPLSRSRLRGYRFFASKSPFATSFQL